MINLNGNEENMRSDTKYLVTMFLMMWAGSAYAHPGHFNDMMGFFAGFSHPFSGVDHLPSMFAIGLLAGQRDGKAIMLVPVVCLSAMALACAAAISGLVISFSEMGILLTLVVSGVLLACRVKLSLPLLLPLVGMFSVFHGYAHGLEMPFNAKGFEYGVGLVAGSSLLLLAGMLTSLKGREKIVAYLGAATAVVGLSLLVV
ncbi:HupE/UreJ family protein [Methylophilus sp. YYY-1]|uniref:HupE/UreJ family protein n=1 Tax=Methylophilus sp. YYY-1 TaxID=2682087 RepID=UPI0023B2946B|nr:HupE/UreJ family protein [Methylophilus sp. YYY-1]MDF0378267.1 urease accessory protein [Methylophilus sp. YYY-1]